MKTSSSKRRSKRRQFKPDCEERKRVSFNKRNPRKTVFPVESHLHWGITDEQLFIIPDNYSRKNLLTKEEEIDIPTGTTGALIIV